MRVLSWVAGTSPTRSTQAPRKVTAMRAYLLLWLMHQTHAYTTRMFRRPRDVCPTVSGWLGFIAKKPWATQALSKSLIHMQGMLCRSSTCHRPIRLLNRRGACVAASIMSSNPNGETAKQLKHVAVFCGASSGSKPSFSEAARALGAQMASEGRVHATSTQGWQCLQISSAWQWLQASQQVGQRSLAIRHAATTCNRTLCLQASALCMAVAR